MKRVSAKLIKLEDNVAHWRVGYADGSTKTIKSIWKMKVKK